MAIGIVLPFYWYVVGFRQGDGGDDEGGGDRSIDVSDKCQTFRDGQLFAIFAFSAI